MSTWCVYQSTWRVFHLPKLLIEDVPEGEEVTKELLERAGYLFSNLDFPWARYVSVQVDAKESPSDLVARIREGDFERITYADLVERAEKPL